MAGLFPAFNLTQVLHEIKQLNLTLPKLNPANFDPKNFTLPKLDDIKLENGMTALEFAKALMTGTISSNTADTNTPDRGLSDVQSGAININPFMDGASMSNALTLAGRDATANSRGIVFGLVGTGRSSSDAAALGLTGAKSSTDTFVINGAGANQNGMSSNLALAPQGRADTSVRAATFDIVGAATTGGLTNALGKKGADAAGLGASMTGAPRLYLRLARRLCGPRSRASPTWRAATAAAAARCLPPGLGDSYGAQFANSLAEGSTSSDTGVLAGTLTGAAKATVGSVATSAKRSASTQALSTSKSGACSCMPSCNGRSKLQPRLACVCACMHAGMLTPSPVRCHCTAQRPWLYHVEVCQPQQRGAERDQQVRQRCKKRRWQRRQHCEHHGIRHGR